MGNDMRYCRTFEQIIEIEKKYTKCIEHMIYEKNITKFMVFTNDKPYAKEFLSKYNVEFIYSNELDYMDIWMISLIKNNIVSFSTLAWWGSYLNCNPDKYIICYKGNRDFLHYPGWIVLS